MKHKHVKRGHYNNFYENHRIGERTRVGSFCDIGGLIGKDCKIQSYCFIPPGVVIGDNVYVGAGTIFINCKYPKVNNPDFVPEETAVDNGAVIGAGCIILPGVIIGRNALIGAGSIVTKSIPPDEVWFGSPAKFQRKK